MTTLRLDDDNDDDDDDDDAGDVRLAPREHRKRPRVISVAASILGALDEFWRDMLRTLLDPVTRARVRVVSRLHHRLDTAYVPTVPDWLWEHAPYVPHRSCDRRVWDFVVAMATLALPASLPPPIVMTRSAYEVDLHWGGPFDCAALEWHLNADANALWIWHHGCSNGRNHRIATQQSTWLPVFVQCVLSEHDSDARRVLQEELKTLCDKAPRHS